MTIGGGVYGSREDAAAAAMRALDDGCGFTVRPASSNPSAWVWQAADPSPLIASQLPADPNYDRTLSVLRDALNEEH